MKNYFLTKLVTQGFCVFKQAFLTHELDCFHNITNQAINSISLGHRIRNKSQGSKIPVSNYPDLSKLISHPNLLKIFNDLEFTNIRFSSGFIISKSKNGPPLFWHQDWWGWNNPISYTDQIIQIFVMIYLQDTNKANGCLRVLPGSHRTSHWIHNSKEAHSEEISRFDNPNEQVYQSIDGELAIEVKYGDVVIGDARLLHGTFSNSSDAERSLITLWFHPNYEQIPASLQARIYELFKRRSVEGVPDKKNDITFIDWPEKDKNLIEPFSPLPIKDIMAEEWNRNPKW